VGHHAEDISLFIEDAGYILERPVGVCFRTDFASGRGVAEGYAVFGFERVKVIRGAEVVAFHVADGNLQDFTLYELVGEGAVCGFDAEMDLLADVLEAGVAHERAGEQAGFREDLEAVADAEDQAATVGEALDRLHDGREAGDGAGAQVIAVGKAAGDEDSVDAAKVFRVVPEEGDGLMGDFGDHIVGIVIAVGTGKDQDPEFHDSRVAVLWGVEGRGC